MVIQWEIFWKTILGDLQPEVYLAHVAIMASGALVFFALDVNNAVRRDQNTPRKFSLSFLIRDNLVRGIGVVVLIMGVTLFYQDFFGTEINARLAFTTGLGIDAVIGTMLKQGKNMGAMKRSREKLLNQYKENG